MQCVWSVLPDIFRNPQHGAPELACTKPHPSLIVDREFERKHQQHHQGELKRKRQITLTEPSVKRQKSHTGKAAGSAWDVVPSPQPAVAQVPTELVDTIAQDNLASAGTDGVKADDFSRPAPETPSAEAPSTSLATTPLSENDTRIRAHERIEAHLNLQILLKHDELRLIEQEIGKCQVALEQLRRCHIMPFPGQPGHAASSDQVITGSGAALEPKPGHSRPVHPPAYGVTDGPYTRHYARWLIPDPSFDSEIPQRPRINTSAQALSGRSTRGTHDALSGTSTPRTARGSITGSHHVLPSNYAIPRDRHAPLIVSRPSDGQLVKVVCKVCGKKDSANVQGFTNHCRIAHGINYASHNEAIIDCGQALGSDEALPVQPPPPPPPSTTQLLVTPVEQQPPPLALVATPGTASSRTLVHPIINAPNRKPNDANESIFAGASIPTTASAHTPLSSTSTNTAAPGSVHPSERPHLSALLQRRGMGADLEELVRASNVKINLDDVEPLISDDEDDLEQSKPRKLPSPNVGHSASKPRIHRGNMSTGGVRVPSSGLSKLQLDTVGLHSATSSGTNTPSHQASQSYIPSTSSVASPIDRHPPTDLASISPGEREIVSLSPHAVDTNPGLVTDNDDDADYADSELDDGEPSDRETQVKVAVRGEFGKDVVMHGVDEAGPSSEQKMPEPPKLKRHSGGVRKRGRPRKSG